MSSLRLFAPNSETQEINERFLWRCPCSGN
jgi:hypothetical protein